MCSSTKLRRFKSTGGAQGLGLTAAQDFFEHGAAKKVLSISALSKVPEPYRRSTWHKVARPEERYHISMCSCCRWAQARYLGSRSRTTKYSTVSMFLLAL